MFRERWLPDYNYWAMFDNGKTNRFLIDSSKPIAPLPYPEIEDVSLGSKCMGGCSYCVLPDTSISRLNNKTSIDILDINNDVLSFDEENSSIFYDTVEQQHEREYDGEIIEIETDDGAILSLTPNHKVFTERGWIKAEDLTVDDKVLRIMR